MKKPKVVDYNNPDKLDVDMITSLDNLNQQEAEKGGWTIPEGEAKNYPSLIQLDSENLAEHKHKHRHQH